jgi:hypothetical protein
VGLHRKSSYFDVRRSTILGGKVPLWFSEIFCGNSGNYFALPLRR